jgi:hypothetical protein
MKRLIQTSIYLILLFNVTVVYAQWSGPSGGILTTNNFVLITQVGGMVGMPGTTFSPLFETRLTSMSGFPGGVMYPLHVAYSGKVGIGTNTPGASLHIANGGNFRMTRTNASTILAVEAIGSMTLKTDGNVNQYRGFFINNGTNDIFKVTPEMILFTDGANDFLKVDNAGNLYARKMIVTLTNPFPDYVFQKEYKLMPLNELATYIRLNKHLPNIKSAEEIAANNKQVELGEMQIILLEKVEELTLYILQQQQQIDELKVKLGIH